MDILVITAVSFVAAGITLFSGFGLGTLLMPVVAIFLPVPIAIAVTAAVHLLNSLFKLSLLRRFVDWSVVARFGIPAILAAVPGALLLDYLSVLPAIERYSLAGREFSMTPLKVSVGLLLIFFATAEISPFLNRFGSSGPTLSAGGVLSGFFGGLSGHQGAFRSAFLIRAGMSKEEFVSTNAAIASLVDCARLLVYGATISPALLKPQLGMIVAATLAAFSGVFLGTRLLKKVTIGLIQKLVAGMLYLLGVLICVGIV